MPPRREVRIGTVIPSTYVPYVPPPPPDPPAVEDRRKRLFDRAAREWTRQHGRGVSSSKVRAVVAREENMPTKKKKKSTRRPAAKRAAPKRKPAAKPKAAKKTRAKKTSVVAARRHPRRAREARRAPRRVREIGRLVSATRRRPRSVRQSSAVAAPRRRPSLVRQTPVLAEAKRHTKKRKSPAKRKPAARRKAHKKSASYVMNRRHPRRKVQAWSGDSAGHSKAAKKGWKTRKGGHKPGKTTKKAAESRRRVRETTMVQSRRRPKKSHRAREGATVKARRRPTTYHTRETLKVQSRRRPKKHHTRETRTVRSGKRRSYVRAPSFSSIGRSALDMGLELGLGVAGFLLADGVDRFLATYDPANATKAGKDKFTSDGTGMLGNALNVASAPDLYRYGALGALTLLPLGGSLFIKHKTIRSSVEGIGLGAGIKLATTLWETLLMPMLIGKDTTAPTLQKSWIARLYPAEVSAAINVKSGKAALSSGGANSTAGTLSGGAEREVGVGKDAGPFALGRLRMGQVETYAGGRRSSGRGSREWIRPTWFTPKRLDALESAMHPNAVAVDPNAAPVAVDPNAAPVAYAQPAWPAHFGERHLWGLRGVGDAVQDIAHTIEAQTGVHPAHAVNAAMHVAGEPHDITQALQRALPHIRREILVECGRHVHPHVARMHDHARHPREHAEWMNERAAEGIPAPEHDAPEQEWREWHGKRAAAGLPPAPHPPVPPATAPRTPAHLRSRHEWQPKSDREIAYERFPTTQQALGIGGPGGPAASGYPGQPGLGEAFADAAQSAAASVPDMPLENAVNVAAHAATEPFDCAGAIERAMPYVRHELTRACAENMGPYIRQMTGIPLPPDESGPPAPPVVVAPDMPAIPAPPVIEFVPSPPPPSWGRTEAEWHEEERRNWDRVHGSHVVAAITKQAAEAAAAPHPDAQKPAVQAAVKAVASAASHAASAAPPGTPPAEVHAAAHEAAKVEAAEHPAVAGHPAVKAAVAAAPPAAAHAVAAQVAPVGTSGLGNPPRNLPVGPPKIGKNGPHVPKHESECGCLDDNPYLGFIGDEEQPDLLSNLN